MLPLQETRCTSMELNEYRDSPTGFGNEAGFFVRLNCRCAAGATRACRSDALPTAHTPQCAMRRDSTQPMPSVLPEPAQQTPTVGGITTSHALVLFRRHDPRQGGATRGPPDTEGRFSVVRSVRLRRLIRERGELPTRLELGPNGLGSN